MAPTATGLGHFPVVEEPLQDKRDGIDGSHCNRAVAYDMDGVTTIEMEAIVTMMLAFGIS